MNELLGRTQTLASRWSSALLVAVVALAGAMTTLVVVSGATVGFEAMFLRRTGSSAGRGPVERATGGLRRGWPPGVLVRARGPPFRRCRWWPVSCAVSSSASV